MEDKPVQDRLNPIVALGNGTVPDECSQLVDDPRATSIYGLNIHSL